MKTALALFGAVLLGGFVAVQSQNRTPSDSTGCSALPTNHRGYTCCADGRDIQVWQRRNTPDDGLGKARDEAVLRHELKHAEQYQLRGCAEMDRIRAIPDSAAVLEVQATCEEIRVLIRYGQNERDLLGYFVLEVERDSGLRDTPKVLRLFTIECPELMP